MQISTTPILALGGFVAYSKFLWKRMNTEEPEDVMNACRPRLTSKFWVGGAKVVR